MKAKLTTTPSFTPQTLAITFETQREIDTFYALFNATPVSVMFNNGSRSNFADTLRDTLRPATTNDRDDIFNNLVIKKFKFGS